jgi:hypothetical protein
LIFLKSTATPLKQTALGRLLWLPLENLVVSRKKNIARLLLDFPELNENLLILNN